MRAARRERSVRPSERADRLGHSLTYQSTIWATHQEGANCRSKWKWSVPPPLVELWERIPFPPRRESSVSKCSLGSSRAARTTTSSSGSPERERYSRPRATLGPRRSFPWGCCPKPALSPLFRQTVTEFGRGALRAASPAPSRSIAPPPLPAPCDASGNSSSCCVHSLLLRLELQPGPPLSAVCSRRGIGTWPFPLRRGRVINFVWSRQNYSFASFAAAPLLGRFARNRGGSGSGRFAELVFVRDHRPIFPTRGVPFPFERLGSVTVIGDDRCLFVTGSREAAGVVSVA